MEMRWGWSNAPRGRGGRGSLNEPPSRHVYCPQHGVIRERQEDSYYCCYDRNPSRRRRNQNRNKNPISVEIPQLPNISGLISVEIPQLLNISGLVDRLCSRTDQQSVILASKLDEIIRRIDLLDMSQPDLVSILRKHKDSEQHIEPANVTKSEEESRGADVIGA